MLEFEDGQYSVLRRQFNASLLASRMSISASTETSRRHGCLTAKPLLTPEQPDDGGWSRVWSTVADPNPSIEVVRSPAVRLAAAGAHSQHWWRSKLELTGPVDCASPISPLNAEVTGGETGGVEPWNHCVLVHASSSQQLRLVDERPTVYPHVRQSLFFRDKSNYSASPAETLVPLATRAAAPRGCDVTMDPGS